MINYQPIQLYPTDDLVAIRRKVSLNQDNIEATFNSIRNDLSKRFGGSGGSGGSFSGPLDIHVNNSDTISQTGADYNIDGTGKQALSLFRIEQLKNIKIPDGYGSVVSEIDIPEDVEITIGEEGELTVFDLPLVDWLNLNSGTGTENNLTMFSSEHGITNAPGFTWEPSDGGFYTFENFLLIHDEIECEGIDCSGGAIIDGTLTVSSNIHYGTNGTVTYIQSRLPPGSDDNSLIIGGAGTSSGIRGAHIVLNGSQAEQPGSMTISIGNEVNGLFALYGSGGAALTIDGTGNTKINEVSGNVSIGLDLTVLTTINSRLIVAETSASQVLLTDASKHVISVATTGTGFAALATSPIFTGTPASGDGTGTSNFNLNGAVGNNRSINFLTAGSLRWTQRSDGTAESGSDAGSDYVLRALNDSGTLIDTPVKITRAAGGTMLLARPLSGTTLTMSGLSQLQGDVLHGAGFSDHETSIVSNTTLTSAYSTILGDATSTSFTLTLPSAAANTGRIYRILKVDTSANTITVGGIVLGGNSGNSILLIQSDGTNWKTISLYDEGDFTCTATGLTTAPTGTASYVRIGDAVSISIPGLGGTTNANTFTYTGLPSHIQPITTQVTGAIKGTHLSTATSAIAAQFSASGTINLVPPNNTLTGWDASATTKAIAFRTSLTYLKL